MTFHAENYLDYDDFLKPVHSQINWSADKIDPRDFSYNINGIKLGQFETNNQRFYITAESFDQQNLFFVESVQKYDNYVIALGPEWVSELGIEIQNPLFANMYILDPKGELVQRNVYEFFQLLGDIGGFYDGIRILIGYFIIIYNTRWYFIKLSSSLFRVGKYTTQQISEHTQGSRLINANFLQNICQQIQSSKPFKIKFLSFRKKQYRLEI